MWRVSPVPVAEMDEGMRAVVRASDEALGGSEWIQAFAHAPDIYKPFVGFYYEYIMTINRYRKTCSTNYASIFPNRRFWN
jgi:hypothetical protein